MKTSDSILVTGGAGFIGSHFVLDWLANPSAPPLVNVDKLTYAGNLDNLSSVLPDPRHVWVHADMGDRARMREVLAQHRPRAIVNFAAESHVDRSIHGPQAFIDTNIGATFALLEEARAYHAALQGDSQAGFRWLQVSTDEVYGTLQPGDAPFTETHRFVPNSPYAASKAAADHLVRAWHHTYGLPVVTTHCSNNYGPYQFPEKLIPLVIANALDGKPLPIYGDGQQVRDWLYVADHCDAIRTVLAKGQLGAHYNVGGWNEMANLHIVQTVCELLDRAQPRADGQPYASQITHVADRPGHDRRYAIDATRMATELGWRPKETFATGIEKTVQWYLQHPQWVARVRSGAHRDWMQTQYGSGA
jgi:dTDP-glucose 4,6-dehydratase